MQNQQPSSPTGGEDGEHDLAQTSVVSADGEAATVGGPEEVERNNNLDGVTIDGRGNDAERSEVEPDDVADGLEEDGGPTKLAKLRGLRWSMAGSATNTIFAQFTFFGSVFVLFLNELGLSKSQIGYMLALLPISSILAPLIGPRIARFGYKRAFLTAFGTRKTLTALLLLTPWVFAMYGSTGTLWFVAIITAGFAILRAVMETSMLPWAHEYVPSSVRGKYAATDNIFATLTGIVAVATAGIVIERTTGLNGYMILIGTGVLIGIISLWAYSHVPGGAAVVTDDTGKGQQLHLRVVFQDQDFRRYLLGVGLLTLATIPLTSFRPLYLQEQVGLEAGRVVWVQIGTLSGALLSSYVWGWAADRYGSKPVMLSGLLILIVLPLTWWLIPRGQTSSLYVALGIAFFQGVANLGWAIGAGRLLFVSIVPPERKLGYMAAYAASVGIISGVSQMTGGQILQWSRGISGQFAIFPLDPYLPLFVMGIALSATSLVMLRQIRAEEAVGVREFASIFFRGNPFLAMTSLIRFQLARDEHSTVLMTEQLGQSRSRLTVEEVLGALTDPRFQVRYEAIITIARMRRDPQLTQALIDLLEGTELALSVNAAWALGRIGDPAAVEPLHRALETSPFRSIQVHSARSLGALGDRDSIPILLQYLRSESDKGLQMACASALGRLGATEATSDLLAFLQQTTNEGARMEIALALARLVGKEHIFIRLLRQVRLDMGTTVAQVMIGLKKRLRPHARHSAPVTELSVAMDATIDEMARDELAKGTSSLSQTIHLLLSDERLSEKFEDDTRLILEESATHLLNSGAERSEYIILALHTLNVRWTP